MVPNRGNELRNLGKSESGGPIRKHAASRTLRATAGGDTLSVQRHEQGTLAPPLPPRCQRRCGVTAARLRLGSPLTPYLGTLSRVSCPVRPAQNTAETALWLAQNAVLLLGLSKAGKM